MRKKLLGMLLTMSVVLGIATSAFAYSGSTSLYLVDHGTMTQYVRDDSSNVYATVEVPYDTYIKVKATTQRYYSGAWHNIESKTSYADYEFGTHYAANFQFSGYTYKSQSIRVRFDYYDPWSGAYETTGYSPTWVR